MPEEAGPPAEEQGARFGLIAGSSGLLVVCGLIVEVLLARVRWGPDFMVAASLPVASGLAVAALCTAWPSLLAVERMRFPLNVTLPLVFGCLQFALLSLATTTESALVQLPSQLTPLLIWSRLSIVLWTAGLQFALLCLWALAGRSRPSGADAGQPVE